MQIADGEKSQLKNTAHACTAPATRVDRCVSRLISASLLRTQTIWQLRGAMRFYAQQLRSKPHDTDTRTFHFARIDGALTMAHSLGALTGRDLTRLKARLAKIRVAAPRERAAS